MTKESILHPVVPTTEGGGAFIGASIKGVPAGHLVTRMPSWMVPGDNLSSADLTGEEDTADTMPRSVKYCRKIFVLIKLGLDPFESLFNL